MRKSGSDKLYYMYNGHADVTALIDASTGVVRGSYYYDAFGNILEQKYYTASGVETTEKINNSITYAGYQYDEETGLYYLNARMYDPKVARFLQEDTYRGSAGDPLSLNLYTYCHNEPIMYWDPTGHKYEGEILKNGSTKDNDVVVLQKMLVTKGYLHMPKGVDYGYYGGLTEAAVERYQKDHGLDDDGIVGDATWKSLGLMFEGSRTSIDAQKQYSKIMALNAIDVSDGGQGVRGGNIQTWTKSAKIQTPAKSVESQGNSNNSVNSDEAFWNQFSGVMVKIDEILKISDKIGVLLMHICEAKQGY